MTNTGPSAAATAVSDAAAARRPGADQNDERRGRRLSIRLPGLIFWREGEIENVEAIFTTAISPYGCALRSYTFFHPGARVRLEIAGKRIEGHVVHSLKDHSVGLVTVGIAFDEDSREFWPVGFDLGR